MLGQEVIGSIPEETRRVAEAAFPKGNVFMQMRDELGVMFEEADFKVLYSRLGQPGIAAWRLLLVCIMQYMDDLSDRQAADAVRDRVSWKYALGLDLADEGFNYSVLSEFRQRLIDGQAEEYLLAFMLERFKERGLLEGRTQQRTDATHVVAAVRALNQLETVGESLRAALNSLATVVPAWLREWVPVEWFERYADRVDSYRLPSSERDREALAVQMGNDGFALLQAIATPGSPVWLRELPALRTLRRVWWQQYYAREAGQNAQQRSSNDMPPAAKLISSPYDPQAHYATKRETTWLGYKVHLTECCADSGPHIITHVETTPANQADDAALDSIHAQLAKNDLLPSQHFVDMGYVDAEHLVSSATDYAVELVGPARPDHSWQAQAKQGYQAANFAIDWEHQVVTCPQGHLSTRWRPGYDDMGHEVIRVSFAPAVCTACPVRALCTKAKTAPRELTFRSQALYAALQQRRAEQFTPAFQKRYAIRSGVEGALSQGVRRVGLRQARYIGLVKLRLQHILTALALNVIRVLAWLAGSQPAKTRVSPFAALAT